MGDGEPGAAPQHDGERVAGATRRGRIDLLQIDNWGWQARIGMFIVSREAVPEAEWWAMSPPAVSVHAARVAARAPWARRRDDQTGRASCGERGFRSG